MAEHQKYKITERIDAGGMAEVFRGVAEGLQGFKKNVAIKRVLPHLTKNKKFISMFLDEARLSLHLQHANIVGVFDIGVSPASADAGGGAYFIVMEFVDGTHLKGMIDSLRRVGKPLTVAQTLYIMMQVCNGLSYAHDVADTETGRPLGIVHRDISPPNILLSKNGEVKLVDFGLAKATSQLESTDPGVVKGKFSYLSPEAANGKEVDKRADIFAVGILMYELLTGKRLFYGENDYQTVELVRQARVPSIRQQNSDVEADLEAVVRKALARDVNARFQSAGELQEAIAQHLFSRGLKVTSRDIAELVRGVVAERAQTQPKLVATKSLIDTLILEELNKFTSIEGEAALLAAEDSGPGARPLSPEELSGPTETSDSTGGGGGDFINTLGWSEELSGEGAANDSQLPGLRNGDGKRSAGWSTPPASPPPVRPVNSGTSSGPSRRGTPANIPAVSTHPRVHAASSVEPIADMLEGASPGAARRAGPATIATITDDKAADENPAKKGSLVTLFVVLVALLMAGAGAVLLFLHRGH